MYVLVRATVRYGLSLAYAAVWVSLLEVFPPLNDALEVRRSKFPIRKTRNKLVAMVVVLLLLLLLLAVLLLLLLLRELLRVLRGTAAGTAAAAGTTAAAAAASGRR